MLLLRDRERSVRAWAWTLAPVLAAVTFLATPAGPGLVFDGVVDPFSQALNLRYGIVFVALAAAVLAAAARRLPAATDPAIAGGVLLVGAITTLEKSRQDVQWVETLAVAGAMALVALGVAAWVFPRLGRRTAAGLAAAGLVLATLLAPAVADRFDRRRLSSNLPFEGARLALEDVDGPIAVAGFCRIYGLYGPTFDRDVEYLTGDDEGIDRPLAATADEWLASLREHGVVALVVGTDICYSALDLPYADWVAAHPEVFELVETSADGATYLVHLP